MDAQPSGFVRPARLDRRAARARWAWTATHVLSPVVLVTAYLLLMPLRAAGVSWLQALTAVLFTTGLPWLVLLWMRRRGSVTDLHVSRRAQRAPVFGMALACMALGFAALSFLQAPPVVFRSLLLVLLGLVACGVVNLAWKLSVHTAVAAFVGLSVLDTTEWGPAVALCLAMLVGWSRIQVGHHTATQVMAGAFVGSGVFLAGLLLT